MEAWMMDELARTIPKEKLEYLSSLLQQGKGKTRQEWMRDVLPRIKEAKEKGYVFTPAEVTAAIAAIRNSSSDEEREKIDAILRKAGR